MYSDTIFFGALIAAGAAFVAGLAGLALWFSSAYCEARWGDFENRWSVMAGCQVKIDGRWIPEDRVREIEPSA